MADGRHIENRQIAISQLRNVGFWWNLEDYSRYWTHSLVTKNWNFWSSRWRQPTSWKSLFLAITYQPIVWFQRNFALGNRTACRQRPRDKNCKFSKSKMVNGRHFENR